MASLVRTQWLQSNTLRHECHHDFFRGSVKTPLLFDPSFEWGQEKSEWAHSISPRVKLEQSSVTFLLFWNKIWGLSPKTPGDSSSLEVVTVGSHSHGLQPGPENLIKGTGH